MAIWPKNPLLYEINTCAWLHDLSRRYRREVTLADVPPQVWDGLTDLGIDAVWLMGVWERSPAGARIARAHPGLQADYRRALPDFTPEDVIGSPYCVHRYTVDSRFGGDDGLVAARGALAVRGIRLLLDFVPNHVARDHPWTYECPDYLIQGDSFDLAQQPESFFEGARRVFAHGRDPHFPSWTDTVQVNAFHPGLRRATVAVLKDIARRCDGVRVDMAMLVVNRIFQQTWGARAGDRPGLEFWPQVIGAVRETVPEFLFLAEAYWDMEWELQQQGFDYCYDKRLYDRLVHANADSVRAHLRADPDYQGRLVRFIENHDEERAAAVFGPGKERAAAVIAATLPGAKLFHEGQLEGWRVKLPVQLGRRPAEPVDVNLRAFYHALLHEIGADVFRSGTWQLCDTTGWPDNDSHKNLLAWCWRAGEARRIVVVNLSGQGAQGVIRIPWDDLGERVWRLKDAFTGDVFMRGGGELRDPGLYVGLEAWGVHLLGVE